MAPHDLPSPHATPAFDWSAHQVLAARRLRWLLAGFRTEDLEDALSETKLRCLRWVVRDGPPRSPVAMVCEVTRGVAADWIRRRRARPPHEPLPDGGDAASPDADGTAPREDLEELRWALFVCAEFLRGAGTRCLDLAEVVWRGGTFKDYASSNGHPEPRVRQWWHRCRAALLRAIRSGRVRMPWQAGEER